MPTPTGAITLSSVQTEFGGANPIRLGEYYRGGAYVPSGVVSGGFGVPSTSGAISLGTLRGLTKATIIADQFQGESTGAVGTPGTVTFASNGAILFGTAGPTSWITPNSTGIGNGYWIRATRTAGNTMDGTFDTWLQLSTNRSWNIQVGGSGGFSSDITLSISSSASGSPVLAVGYWHFEGIAD